MGLSKEELKTEPPLEEREKEVFLFILKKKKETEINIENINEKGACPPTLRSPSWCLPLCQLETLASSIPRLRASYPLLSAKLPLQDFVVLLGHIGAESTLKGRIHDIIKRFICLKLIQAAMIPGPHGTFD